MRSAAFLALVAALAMATPALAAEEGPLIRRGVTAEPATFDPQKASSFVETAILSDLFEGLTTFDALGRAVPGAASEWTVSPDGLTYTFTLRDGLRWSNNDRLQAADFVAGFRRLFAADTDSAGAGPLLVIRNADAVRRGTAKPDTLGVTALDETTLEIVLERPTPTLPMRLAAPAAMPVDAAALKKLGAASWEPGKLVSNGPFRLAGKGKDGALQLVRNPRYRAADTVGPRGVTYRFFETGEACGEAFAAGEVELCADAPVEDFAATRARFGAALRVSPYLGTYYYAFDTRRPPLSDVRVRRALSLAIDRPALAADVWQGGMLPAEDFLPPGLAPGSGPEAPIAARRQRARTLLAAAGFGPGKPLAVTIRVGTGKAHEETAAAVAAQWRTIGVDAKVESEANRRHFERLAAGEPYEVARTGWIAAEPDGVAMLDALRPDDEAVNVSHWKSTAFRQLLGLAARTGDPQQRAQRIRRAAEAVANEAPVIPLLRYSALALVAPQLEGWHATLTDLHPSRYLRLAP
ncbi:peptide ABC transporter substrate-binding protein [Prosthecomicrobium pneumaticum]|uniref:ABC-type oligopeptide transport system substrate-binding subunit n=1 Tax=Prosthecomicrobium pneumaticum TaxID=81895 RepID=A0A7W9FLD0_9HYPH|nr:peptide ABC transporter substrate-binding protein [Prosthecomicrobium pneumaticum]MBB5752789.1 ABC-type oligopeptide transport system substrate-binding subunit [Prosthecomicrobium pneumaticum]